MHRVCIEYEHGHSLNGVEELEEAVEVMVVFMTGRSG